MSKTTKQREAAIQEVGDAKLYLDMALVDADQAEHYPDFVGEDPRRRASAARRRYERACRNLDAFNDESLNFFK